MLCRQFPTVSTRPRPSQPSRREHLGRHCVYSTLDEEGVALATIRPHDAFPHVEDSYRWLAACTCSWERLKGGTLKAVDRRALNRLVPNVDVALQAGVLVYARSLIEFYGPTSSRYPTDLRAVLFGVNLVRDPDYVTLADIKLSIDAHLSHMTELRDPNHPDRRGARDRLDWDHEIPLIVDRLLRLLHESRKQATSCASAFQQLLTATQSRRSDPGFRWPGPIAC